MRDRPLPDDLVRNSQHTGRKRLMSKLHKLFFSSRSSRRVLQQSVTINVQLVKLHDGLISTAKVSYLQPLRNHQRDGLDCLLVDSDFPSPGRT